MAHLFGLGSPIGVRLWSSLGTVFLIRICETFFGLSSGSVLGEKKKEKKAVKMKEVITMAVTQIPHSSLFFPHYFCLKNKGKEEKRNKEHRLGLEALSFNI